MAKYHCLEENFEGKEYCQTAWLKELQEMVHAIEVVTCTCM